MTINISDSVRTLIGEATTVDGTPPISDQALIAVSQGKRHLVEFNGEAVGIIGEGELDLVVHPTHRGRGVGSAALEKLLQHENRQPADELRAWAHGENPAASALLSRAGFKPVRELLRMGLDPARLGSAIAQAKEMPQGFEVHGFDPESSQQADDWVLVNAAAFATHPEQGSMTRDDFDALTREAWFDREDLRLAFDVSAVTEQSAKLAAFAWVKTTHNNETTETELYALGVAPEQSGKGLGAAMLGESMRRMSTHHPDRISLYVEGNNISALRLYERAGFTVQQRSTQWFMKSQ